MSVSQMPETVNDVLAAIGISTNQNIHYQQTPQQLSDDTVNLSQGKLNDTGALVINTGEFTGRSPKDKFCVKDEITAEAVHWNDFNLPISPQVFDNMHTKLIAHLSQKELWVRDA